MIGTPSWWRGRSLQVRITVLATTITLACLLGLATLAASRLEPLLVDSVDHELTAADFASEWFEGMKLEGRRKGKGLTPAGAADLEWRLTHHLLPAFATKQLRKKPKLN